MKCLVSIILGLCFFGICFAGPAVVVHPKAASVKIWNNKGLVVQDLADPKQIKSLQDAFRNAKHLGDSKTMQVQATHKIDFADRWLIDTDKGEIVVVSKMISDVYQLDEKDAITVRELIHQKAQPGVGAGSR